MQIYKKTLLESEIALALKVITIRTAKRRMGEILRDLCCQRGVELHKGHLESFCFAGGDLFLTEKWSEIAVQVAA